MKRPFLALLLATLAACNIFNPSGDGDASVGGVDGYILQGQEDLRQQDFAAAKAHFSAALALDSTKSLAWHGLGKAHVGLLPMDSLLKVYQKLTTKDSTGGTQNPFQNASDSLINALFRPLARMANTYSEFIRRDTLGLTDRVLSSRGDQINFSAAKIIVLAISPRILLPRNPTSEDSLLPCRDSTLRALSKSLTNLMNLDSLKSGNFSNIAKDIANITLTKDTTNCHDSAGVKVCATDTTGKFNASAVDAINQKVTSMGSSLSDIKTVTSLLGVDTTKKADTSTSDGKIQAQAQAFVQSNPQAVNLIQFADRIDNDGNGCVDEKISDGKNGTGDGVPGDYRLGYRDSTSRFKPAAGVKALNAQSDSIANSRLVDLDRKDTLINGQWFNFGTLASPADFQNPTAPLIYADAEGHLEIFRKYWEDSSASNPKRWRHDLDWSADSAVIDSIPVFPTDTLSASPTKGKPFLSSLQALNPIAKSDQGRKLTVEELVKIRLRILTVANKRERLRMGRRYIGGCWTDVAEPK